MDSKYLVEGKKLTITVAGERVAVTMRSGVGHRLANGRTSTLGTGWYAVARDGRSWKVA